MSKKFYVLILFEFITQVMAQTPPKVPVISTNSKIITIPTQPQIPNYDELGTALQVLKDMPKSKTEKIISLINLLKVISTKQTDDDSIKSVPVTQTIENDKSNYNVTNYEINSKVVSKMKTGSKLTKLKAKKLQSYKKQLNQSAPVPKLVPIFKTRREPPRRKNILQKKPDTVGLVGKTTENIDPTQVIPRPQRTEDNEINFANSFKKNTDSYTIQNLAIQGKQPIPIAITRGTFNTTATFKLPSEPNLAKPNSMGALNPVGITDNQDSVIRNPRLTPDLILVGSVTRVPNQIQPNQNMIIQYIQERKLAPTKALQTSLPINKYQVNPSTKTSLASLVDIYKMLSILTCNIPKMANTPQKSPCRYSMPPLVNMNNVLTKLQDSNINLANLNLKRQLLPKSSKDMIVFKPKTFSFMNCNSNLLKQITMKVLIPLYTTKIIQ